MSFEIKSKADMLPYLSTLIKDKFKVEDFKVAEACGSLINFISKANPNIFIGIEHPYVDKLYRNSYYNYWSNKFKDYERDCIRLSFFDCSFTINDFFEEVSVKNLQNHFLGFLVLRPIPKIIGRSILRPDFFVKTSDLYVSTTIEDCAINGVKFKIEGFPHSSQDEEMMVCAETALWSLIEYFSHRYHDYTPIYPKEIHQILSSLSVERQIPSAGLMGQEIAYVLKSVGFGVKIYSADRYSEAEFFNILKIYIESGIPLMVMIQNSTGIGHVMNVIGRTEFNNIGTYSAIDNLSNNSALYDFYEQSCEYVAIDDNLPPYCKINFTNPAINYAAIDPRFNGCTIPMAVVPLHKKIYVEADKAKEFAIEEIKKIDKLLSLPSSVMRVFLTSSRSYKNYISLNPDLSTSVKTLIVNKAMPKFIWIVELSTPALVQQNKACGLFVIDATEHKTPLTIITLVKNLYIGELIGRGFGVYTLPLPPFSIFYNLKKF